MRLFKILLATAVFVAFSTFPIHADENFDFASSTEYTVTSNDAVDVRQTVTITNKKEFLFTPTYTISYGFTDIENASVSNAAGQIPFTIEEHEGNSIVRINFQNPPKGVGTRNTFTVSFTTTDLLSKKGEVYEIAIPGISDPATFETYDTKIVVPDDFPEPTIVKPTRKDGELVFTKDETTSGILAIFGDVQHYRLRLTYNIENKNVFPIKTEVALPPDTNYQDVLIDTISLAPNTVQRDEDGNWIATYSLLPGEKKIITADVLIRMQSTPKRVALTAEARSLYTGAQTYWDVDDGDVRGIAKTLQTPEQIYNYVVENLSYDYEKVAVDDTRLGGAEVLDRRDFAVCLEFSDLFVTLARAAGIPARSVEGYAYTENERLRPLSLLEDVLHAWAEYYDEEKKMWVMVDPTWGNTTNGADYFTTLDLDHIAFVVKGVESTYPIPAGGYKFQETSKDIAVEFLSSEEFTVRSFVEFDTKLPTNSLVGLPFSGTVNVMNKGNGALYDKTVTVTNETTGDVQQYHIDVIPPYGAEQFSFQFDPGSLTNQKHTITIRMDDTVDSQEIMVSYFPDGAILMIGGGILLATALVTWASVQTGRVYLQRRKRHDSVRREGKGSKKAR